MSGGEKAPHKPRIEVGLRSPRNHRTGKVPVIGEALQQGVVGGSHGRQGLIDGDEPECAW